MYNVINRVLGEPREERLTAWESLRWAMMNIILPHGEEGNALGYSKRIGVI